MNNSSARYYQQKKTKKSYQISLVKGIKIFLKITNKKNCSMVVNNTKT